MRLVKNHRVRDPLPDASAEHVLVKAIKDQRCKRLLQVVILRGVDANDNRLLAFPKALVVFGQIKEALVVEFLQPSQERAKATIRFSFGAENL